MAVKGAIKAAPYVAKKAFDTARDVSSHFLRDPKLQEKAINYALKKGRPLIDRLVPRRKGTNVKKFNLMFYPLVPYVLCPFYYFVIISLFQGSTFNCIPFLLSCHLSFYCNDPLLIVIL